MTNSNNFKYTFLLLLALGFSLACNAVSTSSLLSQPTSIPTSSPTSVATPTESSPSSEGWIAFVNKNNIWLIHPDGSDLKQVTDNPTSSDNNSNNSEIRIKWSHDGQKLAFSQNNRLYVLDIETFNSKMLVDDTAGGFDWSLTNKQIIYDTMLKSYPDFPHLRNNGFWVVNLETGNKRQIVKTSDAHSAIIDPQWSPEASHVIFTDATGPEMPVYGVVELNTGLYLNLPLAVCRRTKLESSRLGR